MPIPNSFPRENEPEELGYAYLGFQQDGSEPAQGRWSERPSIDGMGEFETRHMEPLGEEPALGRTRENSGAQTEQM